MIEPKFGDVLRDKEDEEVVMAICDLKHGDWRVVVLNPTAVAHDGFGEVTWRDLSTGTWDTVDE